MASDTLQEGPNVLLVATLIRFAEHAMGSSQHFDKKLHATHLTDVASGPAAIHPQLPGLHLEFLALLLRHLLESLLNQILSRFLHVAAQPLAETVDRVQIDLALPDVLVP